jgi:hypothetical protein
MTSPPTRYRSIGKGFYGSVWTYDSNPSHAIKREDSGPGHSLSKDFTMHTRILTAFSQHPPTSLLSIPACHALIPSPTQPGGPLISERIPAM